MNFSTWASAVLNCLRDKHFWRETARETFVLIAGSSSGFGAALTAAALRMGHRVLTIASAMSPITPTTPITIYKPQFYL